MNPLDFTRYIDNARGETQHIAFFLAAVAQTTTTEGAVHCAVTAIDGLYQRRGGSASTPNSRCTFASYYRKSFLAMSKDRQLDEGIAAAVVPLLKATDEDIAASKSKQTAKTRAQQSHLTPFNPEAFLAAIETGLNSQDWRELAAALIASCHARPADLLKDGSFKPLSEYQVEFTSRAKKRGGTAVGVVWTMIPAARFIDGFNRLRRMPEVARYQGMTKNETDSSANSSLGLGIQHIFGAVLPVPHDAKGETSASNLRAAATNVSQWLYGADEIHPAELAIRQLMHDGTNAEASYRDYRLVTADGAAIKDYGVRRPDAGAVVPYYFYSLDSDGKIKPDSVIEETKGLITMTDRGRAEVNVQPTTEKPKSMTKSSITVTRDLIDELKAFEGETRAQQLSTALALASKAAELEKQLAYQVRQNEALRKQQTAPAPTEPATKSTTTTEQPAAMNTTAEIDVRKLEDSAIVGKKPGYAEERIRRTVQAIQDYNAGIELAEQIAVNKGSLRTLAAASVTTVNKWADEHAAELEAYATAQGHGFRQNVGKDLLTLVPLAWNP
jgi:hypothetical protein